MCGFLISSLNIENLEEVNFKLRKRGPDFTFRASVERFTVLHNLLDISKQLRVQPYEEDGVFVLFNGEFYNPNISNEGKFLAKEYLEKGETFISSVDGEFALVIIDTKKEEIFLFTDTFRTRPLFYSLDGGISISSYESSLRLMGCNNIVDLDNSKMVKISFQGKVLQEDVYFEFEIKDEVKDFDKVFSSLEKSVVKRTKSPTPFFIGLSSGYDSGTLLAVLLKYEIKFETLTLWSKDESHEVLERRLKLCYDNNIGSIKLNSSSPDQELNRVWLAAIVEEYKYEYDGSSILKEPSSLGYMLMFKEALNRGLGIFMTGQGGDEVLSNYSLEFSFDNLRDVFPWEHFYRNRQRDFINQVDRISGSLGIESRYPFLDKSFVQDFLNLDPNIKNGSYKSVFHEYMNSHDMPFKCGHKTGMGHRW